MHSQRILEGENRSSVPVSRFMSSGATPLFEACQTLTSRTSLAQLYLGSLSSETSTSRWLADVKRIRDSYAELKAKYVVDPEKVSDKDLELNNPLSTHTDVRTNRKPSFLPSSTADLLLHHRLL